MPLQPSEAGFERCDTTLLILGFAINYRQLLSRHDAHLNSRTLDDNDNHFHLLSWRNVSVRGGRRVVARFH